MKRQNNADIRALFKANGLHYSDVAQQLEISVSALYRWLRIDMTPKHKRLIEWAIAELTKEV